jgi:hypothetical protein
MRAPAKIAWPSTVHVLPPLVLLRIPCPACESEMLSSPVPAKMTWPELSVTPLSELRQTPPPALPA